MKLLLVSSSNLAGGTRDFAPSVKEHRWQQIHCSFTFSIPPQESFQSSDLKVGWTCGGRGYLNFSI